jgi:hypothetical protein
MNGLRPWLWIVGGVGAAIVAGIGVFYWLNRNDDGAPPPASPPPYTGDIAKDVHLFCGKCHAYPPPDSFPRSAWREEVEQGYRFFRDAHDLSMAAPPLEEVVKYYENHPQTPRELPLVKPAKASTPLPVRLTRKDYAAPPQISGQPPAISNVNLVHLFDKKRLDVLACDMRHGLVMALSPYAEETGQQPRWEILGRVPNPAHAEVVDLEGNGKLGILVANLGSFPPTDNRDGSVVWLRPTGDRQFTPITLLKDVGRVADVQAYDFRNSGKKDLVVGVFGWRNTGEILYLENQTTEWSRPKFVPRVLDDRHGTIHVPVIPKGLMGSGKPDFVALISQEHETVVAFLNDGRGNFTKKTIYEAPHPAYGSSGIQVVDFDGDGRLDVLYTNGDTLDKPYLLKPYHGIQLLRNPGKFPFEHRPIAPMYGVHRAVAADFTGTGKKDIVAVSFLPEEGFPQRKDLQLDAIVFLEQTPAGKFERHALETVTCNHVTCAVGDIFDTGRIDLVVGQFRSAKKLDFAITIWKNEGLAGSRQGPAKK